MRDYKKRLALAKNESVYLTDAAPVLATDAIETIGLSVTPYAGNIVTKDTDGKGHGNRLGKYDSRIANVSFGVYAGGSGAAGTAPRWGRFLRSAGFTETELTLTSTTYALHSGAFESTTLHAREDGEITELVGMRNNITIDLTAGQRPMINVDGRAFMPSDPVTDVYPGAIDLSAFLDPDIINDANNQFTIDGYAACLYSANIDVGVQLVNRDLPNCKDVHINDKQISGSLNVEAPTIADKNFYANVAGATVPFQFIHGTTAGEILTIDGLCQLMNLQKVDQDGILHYTFDLNFVPTTGNDELTITLT